MNCKHLTWIFINIQKPESIILKIEFVVVQWRFRRLEVGSFRWNINRWNNLLDINFSVIDDFIKTIIGFWSERLFLLEKGFQFLLALYLNSRLVFNWLVHFRFRLHLLCLHFRLKVTLMWFKLMESIWLQLRLNMLELWFSLLALLWLRLHNLNLRLRFQVDLDTLSRYIGIVLWSMPDRLCFLLCSVLFLLWDFNHFSKWFFEVNNLFVQFFYKVRVVNIYSLELFILWKKLFFSSQDHLFQMERNFNVFRGHSEHISKSIGLVESEVLLVNNLKLLVQFFEWAEEIAQVWGYVFLSE